MSRAQLQALTSELLDARPSTWFESYLPTLLAARRDVARAFGGRYGFIVGAQQWIVDLDEAVVEGDALTACVDASDLLDAVVCVAPHDLERVLRGSHGRAPSLEVTHGTQGDVARLLRFFEECARP